MEVNAMPKFRRKPKPSKEPVVEAIRLKRDFVDTPGMGDEGDWLVQDERGFQYYISNDDFQKIFEPTGG
jgi:hypothetical protein